MRTRNVVTAIALLFGTWFMAVPTATAEATVMNGTYRYTDENGNAGTWTIANACTAGCLAYVTTSPGHGFTAKLLDGVYVTTREVPDGLRCPLYFVGDTVLGGGTYSVVVHQWWNPRTLTGAVDYLDTPAPCGVSNLHDTFSLTPIV